MSARSCPKATDARCAPGSVITLPGGLVGLPHLRRWILLDMGFDLPLQWLQSLDEEGFGFPVTTPEYYYPHCAPAIPVDLASRLAAGVAGEVVVLIVTTVLPGGARLIGNLAAPLLIHTGSRLGIQHVVEEEGLPLGQEIDYVRFGRTANARRQVGQRQEIGV